MSCNNFSLNPALNTSLSLATSPCELSLSPTLTVNVVSSARELSPNPVLSVSVSSACEKDFGLSLNPSLTVKPDVYRLVFKVVDHKNVPVSNASVIVEDVSSGAGHSYLTDDSGTVVVDVRGPGLYRVTVRKSGKKRVVREYEVSGITHDTLILEPIKLTVIVVDPRNRPVSGATVWVYMGDSLIARDVTR